MIHMEKSKRNNNIMNHKEKVRISQQNCCTIIPWKYQQNLVLHEQFNGHPVAKVVKQKFSKLRETDQELLHLLSKSL